MRSALALTAASLLTLTACASGPQEGTAITWRSTFEGSTKGLVLHKDGDAGHAGMFGTNCPFDTWTGQVTGDYDLPDSDEDVQDGEETELGGITLAAVIPGTVHVLDKTGGEYSHVSLPLPGVTQGRLTEDGVVGMTEDCALSWVGLDGALRRSVTLSACEAGLETEPATGLTLVAGSPARLTDGNFVTEAEASGDLVAFDGAAQAFYVARSGEARLSALELDGSLRWSVETSGPVTALDDGGETGAAGVVLELAEGGAVAFFDGLTGARTRFAETPSAADDLSVSGNGQVVALVRPQQAFFFELGE
ncbi:MAG: hypothetical protein H6741_28670 [Alphaproteobacteria bacterium]|nr:hypothetical protein [Alphaproteobacteria bacterium]